MMMARERVEKGAFSTAVAVVRLPQCFVTNNMFIFLLTRVGKVKALQAKKDTVEMTTMAKGKCFPRLMLMESTIVL